jgi:hypothetical protein
MPPLLAPVQNRGRAFHSHLGCVDSITPTEPLQLSQQILPVLACETSRTQLVDIHLYATGVSRSENLRARQESGGLQKKAIWFPAPNRPGSLDRASSRLSMSYGIESKPWMSIRIRIKISDAVAFGDFLGDAARVQAAEVGIRLTPKKDEQ